MRQVFLPALLIAAATGTGHAQPADRGQLLYANHCIECHTSQVHWRSLRLARDWDTLRAQVVRWQSTARLQWSEEDIENVTRHLNDTVYRFSRSQALRTP